MDGPRLDSSAPDLSNPGPPVSPSRRPLDQVPRCTPMRRSQRTRISKLVSAPTAPGGQNLLPLALLQESAYSHVEVKGEPIDRAHRLAAGHSGSAHLENPVQGAASRLGNLRACAAAFKRCSQHPARLPLSCPASPRAPRMDQG